MKPLLAVYTLWLREVVRFYRQPSRLAGALGSPLVFWLLIGSGIGTSFHDSGSETEMNYLQYFFPGTMLMILLFTAIFSTISLIEDRREGFLQAVLVAPVPRVGIVLGKVLGGATLAFSQGLLFLLVIPFLGLKVQEIHWWSLAAVMFLNAVTLTGLGFLIAWHMHSIQGFHAVMNLFLIPLWLLSGALFPESGALGWVQSIMKWNPLTYELALLRRSFYEASSLGADLPAWNFSLAVTGVFGLVVLALSIASVHQRSVKHLV